MKSVLSPFRKDGKDPRKAPPRAAAANDFEWDDSKTTQTAWATTTHKAPAFRGTFGSRAKGGGPFSVLKRAPTVRGTGPAGWTSAKPGAELSPFESSSRESRLSLASDSPSERSQDLENLLNPPTQRRLSHLSGSLSCLPPKPLKSSPLRTLTSRESSAGTSATTTDDSNGAADPEDASGHASRRALLGPDSERECKKYRTRRMSCEGALAPLSSSSSHSSFSHLAASVQEWKQIERSTPPKAETSENICGSPARSVASSRKRGVGGSPLCSDNDDMSIQGCLSLSRSSSSASGRPIRSRSRVFSPEGPPAPLLPFSLGAVDAIGSSTHHSSPSQNGRGVMDIDSDHETDDESENDSPDSSIEHEDPSSIRPEYEAPRHVETEQDVLDSMSSYPHLKFLIKALREEAKRKPALFGETTNWTVAPSQSWPSTARAAFVQWATLKLGFAVRAVGGTASYLQISKPKGASILEKLIKAHKLYKVAGRGQSRLSMGRASKAHETFDLLNNGYGSRRPSVTQLRRGNSTSMLSSPYAIYRPPNNHDDMAALDLASKMKDLSVKDKAPGSSDAASQSLVRIVTLDTALSNGAVAAARTSLDQVVTDSRDIVFHMHGRDPGDDAPYLRPPRNSNASNTSHRSSAPFPTIGAAQSFDCIETPCMNDDKNWGSCPYQGRDWGDSERCETETLERLMERFEHSTQDAGIESLRELTGSGMSSNLNSDFEMEYESGKVVDEKLSELPEETLAVRFEVASNERIIDEKERQRRRKSFAKLKRISLCYQLALCSESILPQPQLGALFESCPMKIDAIRDRITSESSVEIPSEELDVPFDWEYKKIPLDKIFAFLTESELKRKTSLVSRTWADAAATAHAALMTASIGYLLDKLDEDGADDVDDYDEIEESSHLGFCLPMNSIARSMERPWNYLASTFPWGQYLAEGGMKTVYKAFNTRVGAEEAIAVMDVEHIREKSMIAAELAVSSLLSDLVRRGVCPNFIITRGVFNCPYAPPESHWGSEDNKAPKGLKYSPHRNGRPPRQPSEAFPGRYHYVRMELCDCGDAEEYIKGRPNALIKSELAQCLLFQVAFALHAAADRCSMKHYDIKLLNIFLQKIQSDSDSDTGNIILRYGLGSHVFSLKMQAEDALYAKLADYGTANVKPESNGQPVTIGQFTTIENTPPEFMILGDKATQGHGHDNWGLGLVMLHLFTGDAPYEEIMEECVCPLALKKQLRRIWEDEDVEGYEVIRSVILSDVELDEAGHIMEGEPDETLYDTLYRFLVLFGLPDDAYRRKDCPKVWDAIFDTLVGTSKPGSGRGKATKCKKGPDASQYSRDCRKYSVRMGSHKSIARARHALQSMDGGLELLFGLCNFDPSMRLSAMDVLNSSFMAPLREKPGTDYGNDATIRSFTAFSTHR